MNKYEYFGSEVGSVKIAIDSNGIRPIFGDTGNSVVDGNPYKNKLEFFNGLLNSTRFGYDHFINNVQLPEWLDTINHTKDVFWYDDEKDVWITTSNNIIYHLFV